MRYLMVNKRYINLLDCVKENPLLKIGLCINLTYGIQMSRLTLLLQFLIQSIMKSKRIQSYHITNHLLGSGSFSQVYLGHSPNDGKVAVKMIPRDRIKDNEIGIFQREINLLNHCKNDYIINFIDVKKTQTNFYIFLEYCDGGNLAEYIATHTKLQEKEAMAIFSQIVKGMKAMRTANVVHRDLKSANIMLKEKNIKIVDFGLATKFSKGEMLNSYSGTPCNMAPQILKGEQYNQKAEIYSAGTILYQMLFGVLPFEDRSPHGLLKKIENAYRSKNYLPHWTEKTTISFEIKQLLIKMLQPNPEKRIELDEVAVEVKRWQNLQISERINQYKRLSAGAIPYMAILGGFAQMFNFDLNKVKEKSIYDMDLRICGKLSHKLISKELEWLKVIDLIRV